MNNQNKEIILLKDLGMKFPKETSKQKKKFGLYKCFCNNIFKSNTYDIKRGHTKSCGCLYRKHNLTNHRLYNTWSHMIDRCTKTTSKDYINYGARGISVCDKWLNINNFINDMYPTFKEGLSIDRIDNNKGYSKENCRWATKTMQNANKRKLISTNTSGYRGVAFRKDIKKWRAIITANKKRTSLGHYDTAIKAAKAYDQYIIDNNLEHTRNF